MEEKKKNNKIMFIILGIVIVVLIGIVAFLVLKLNNNQIENVPSEEQKYKQSSDNLQVNENFKTSFANLKADDEKFDEVQSTIIDYFDMNYFTNFAVSELQQYPQIFRGAKLQTNAIIMKVLKSTDTEFEVIAVQGGGMTAEIGTGITGTWGSSEYENKSIEEIPDDQLIVIRGKQLNKRLTKGDIITLYGRYNNIEDFNIDGKSHILPIINSINLIQLNSSEKDNIYRFNIDKIKTVAEYVFGKDIKISTPVLGEDYSYEADYAFEPFYKITLDDQSNSNFSKFNMYRNYGMIEYNEVSANTYKRIFVASDFQHYIVSTYDKKLKHIYIEYFDRDFKKIWSREFDYNSNSDDNISPMDYSATQMAAIIDNDLYLIDLSTGENIIEPVLVGEKVRVNMMEDGIILIGNDNKDTIMKVSYDGKIIFRTNGNVSFERINGASTQIIDNKMVVFLYGTGVDPNNPDMGDDFPFEKYIVLNVDGTIETETETEMGLL